MDLATLAGLPDEVIPAMHRQMAVHILQKYGAPGMHALYRRLRDFAVTPAMLQAIRCPVLACIGEGEGAVPIAQAAAFCEGVGGPATRHDFAAAWGADTHCQLGNIRRGGQVIFDWMDDKLGV